MALMRAQKIASESGSASPPVAVQEKWNGRERWLSGANGGIVGRPDLVRGDAVVEYKTGDIHEHSDTGDNEVAKASYVRQVQLYAFLVKECTGRWPTRGVLLPMEGPPLEVELEPAACERIATDALELLDSYNRQIQAGGNAAGLANPSPQACRWCSHQLLCSPFWEAADDSWSEHIGTAAVGGSALAPPQPIHGGAALALSVSGIEGTAILDAVGLAPLSPEIHPALRQIQTGTRVRVIGLARRADGTVVPTARTVLARLEDLPVIVLCGGETKSRDAAKT
jgi:hypothetical protein